MMKWDGTNFYSWGINKPQQPTTEFTPGALIADPVDSLVMIASPYGSGFTNRTYAAVYTWVDANGGETLVSAPASVILTDQEAAHITLPMAYYNNFPAGAVGWKVYIDMTSSGSFKLLQYSANGVNAAWIALVESPGLWAGLLGAAPPIANTTGQGRTFSSGRKYRAAYGSASGHVGLVSDPTLFTGVPGGGEDVLVHVANPSDLQCDRIFLFATVDGGNDYYLLPNLGSADYSWPLDAGAVTTITDGLTDAQLDKSKIAPTLNAPPPVGKYVCEWGGRIYVFNLVGSKQDIAYSGYERILLGRPEESFPPNNRLRLAIGADEIRGGGVIEAGIVAFSKSNEMFMLRGTVTDKSTDAPVEYLAELQKLPWNTGCASHYSIARTPYGLVWLASDKTIKIFDGTGEPRTLAGGLLPILRSITPGTEVDCRGAFFCYLEREWYLLLCAVDGETQKNRILIVDLDPDADANVGAFQLQIEADAMDLVEDANGKTRLLILQAGVLQELTILSDTTGGISLVYAATENKLPARWRSGYFAGDSPEWWKLFRFGKLLADRIGFRVQLYLVDDEQYTFRNPLIVPFKMLSEAYFAVNQKSRRISVEIQFPEDDVAANVLELAMSYIPTSQR
jgi:hypothetical protein